MKNSTKIKLATLSNWTIVITISIIVIWFISFIIIQTFSLTIFASRTSIFLSLILLVASFIVVCSFFLNISVNLSLIADSMIKEGEENNYYLYKPVRRQKYHFILLFNKYERSGYIGS